MGKGPTTPHSRIFEYWRDKAITRFGDVVEDKPPYDGTIPVVYDWGEPMCWCCGRDIHAEDDPRYFEYLGREEIEKIWNLPVVKSGLNRCHIVPCSLGGVDTPSNLFLMCEKCHKNSPDTRFEREFLRFIYHCRTYPGSYVFRNLNKAGEILRRDYGVPGVLCIPDYSNDVGCHGGGVSDSSVVAAYIGESLELYTKALLRGGGERDGD